MKRSDVIDIITTAIIVVGCIFIGYDICKIASSQRSVVSSPCKIYNNETSAVCTLKDGKKYIFIKYGRAE